MHLHEDDLVLHYYGEMPPDEKRKYSHRAAAARALQESGALQQLIH